MECCTLNSTQLIFRKRSDCPLWVCCVALLFVRPCLLLSSFLLHLSCTRLSLRVRIPSMKNTSGAAECIYMCSSLFCFQCMQYIHACTCIMHALLFCLCTGLAALTWRLTGRRCWLLPALLWRRYVSEAEGFTYMYTHVSSVCLCFP